jgi:hypothetical protein
MSDAAFHEMMVLCGTATGLALLGATRVLLAGRSVGVRLAATTACAVAPALGLAALGFPALAPLAVGLVGAAGVGLALVGSAPAAWVVARLRPFGRPGGQAAALWAVGGVVLVGSLARYEIAVEAADADDIAFMSQVTWRPPLREAVGPGAVTDAGHPVALWQPVTARTGPEVADTERRTLDAINHRGGMIRTGPADETANCHGWVFAGGRYWVSAEGVEAILADNGYQPVSDPRPGDLVVYRGGGLITHTAVVRTVAPGGLVLVESKWGWMGVFLHAPEGSSYGREYTYFRSPREGHLLGDLGGSSAAAPADRDPGVGH